MAMHAILLAVLVLLLQADIDAQHLGHYCSNIAASYETGYGKHCAQSPKSSPCVAFLQDIIPKLEGCKNLTG
ncbi:unnamed protein product [Dicrocoelium dendriticum]|nr:unnamed protein product [Dicrocoelium dendriticum]